MAASPSSSKRWTVVQPRTADRPTPTAVSVSERDEIFDLASKIFAEPREALQQLKSVRWKQQQQQGEGSSSSYPSSVSRILLTSPPSAISSQNGDLEELSAGQLRELVERLRLEIRVLQDQIVVSGTATTVKKQPPQHQSFDRPTPTSLTAKISLAGELDDESFQDTVGEEGRQPISAPPAVSNNNIISDLVNIFSLGNVIMRSSESEPTVDNNVKPATVASAAAATAQSSKAAVAGKGSSMTSGSSSKWSQSNSSSPSATSARPGSGVVSADHGVEISYVGSQRIVTRLESVSKVAVTMPPPVSSTAADSSSSTTTSSASATATAPAPAPATTASVAAVSAPVPDIVSTPVSQASTITQPRQPAELAVTAEIAASSSAESATGGEGEAGGLKALAARKKQAESLSLSQLTSQMKDVLRLNSRLSVTETVSNACAALGLQPTGNVKADAVLCFLALPTSSVSAPIPSQGGTATASPTVRSDAQGKTTMTTTPDPRSVPLPTPAADLRPPTCSPLPPSVVAESSLARRLRTFYRRHNPEKTEKEIEDIMLHYAGREEELITKLERKYNTKFT